MPGFAMAPGVPHYSGDVLLGHPGAGQDASTTSPMRGPAADVHPLYNPLVDGVLMLPTGLFPHPGSAEFLHLGGGPDDPGGWN